MLVSQADGEDMARRLARDEGLFGGVSAAGARWVALRMAEQARNATIVLVVCDRCLSIGVFPAWPEVPGDYRYCPRCATALQSLSAAEDSGEKVRLRCSACGWTHWNNPTPVLAAVVECVDRGGQVLLARNAGWSGRMFALITGFMEAGESPEEGIRREVTEETALKVDALKLIGVYEFQRMNQVIIAYHVQARGAIRLSPELVEYRLFEPADLRCWPAGTGYALADWLRSRGYEPRFMEVPRYP